MSSFDFSAPFVAARLIDQNGDAHPFWINTGTSESRPLLPGGEALQAMAFVQQVEISFDLGGIPQINLSLTPPFREGIAFLNSPLANSAGRNQLEVQFGYSSGVVGGGSILSPVFVGQILEPDITIDTDIQISLNTQGIGPLSAAGQTGQVVSESGETRRQLIQRIANHGGRSFELNFEDADINDVARGLLDAQTVYSQGNKTDWLALWELVTSCRCWMLFTDGVLRILSRVGRWRGEPLRRYRMFDYPGGRLMGHTLSTADMPLLSFTCSTPAVWLPQGQFGVRLADVSDTTREVNERLLRLEDLADPVGGDGSDRLEGRDDVPANPANRPGDPDDADVRGVVSEEMARGENLGVQVEIESMGDPEILPGNLVRLAGLGQRFDNRIYAVHKVSHVIGSGGFTTNLTLVTNIDALTAALEGGLPPSGPVNTSDVSQATGNEVTPSVDPESEG